MLIIPDITQETTAEVCIQIWYMTIIIIVIIIISSSINFQSC